MIDKLSEQIANYCLTVATLQTISDLYEKHKDDVNGHHIVLALMGGLAEGSLKAIGHEGARKNEYSR